MITAKRILNEYKRTCFSTVLRKWREKNQLNPNLDTVLIRNFIDIHRFISVAQLSKRNLHRFDAQAYLQQLATLTEKEEGYDRWESKFLKFLGTDVNWNDSRPKGQERKPSKNHFR